MMHEPNELSQGETDDIVLDAGDYTAVGCCRAIRRLVKGEAYPMCSVHGSTKWGLITPGSATAAHEPRVYCLS